MKSEIIAVGSELLLGDTADTNSHYLSQRLKEIGVDVYHISVVGDNFDRMKSMLLLAGERSDLVIVSGGLGPTVDDITKQALADITGRSLVYDPTAKEKVDQFFSEVARTPDDSNYKQAEIPEGADALLNPIGLACGVWLPTEGCTFVLLPGPPNEMRATFASSLLPRLLEKSGKQLFDRHYRFFGIGESELDAALRDYTNGANPTLAPYAKAGECELRLAALAENSEAAEALMKPLDDVIRNTFTDSLYTVDRPNLQSALAEILTADEITISTAESCTGGLISKWLTEPEGSSKYFIGGVCTYANEAKVNILGVRQETLDRVGAVSEETALEMAKGAKRVFQTDIAVSTTGLIGPTGGTQEKPVGLVYIGIVADDYEDVMSLQLPSSYFNSRERIRTHFAKQALFNVLRYLNTK